MLTSLTSPEFACLFGPGGLVKYSPLACLSSHFGELIKLTKVSEISFLTLEPLLN
jgi:hypothetical protein